MKKLLRFSSFSAIAVGLIMIMGAFWGICFTYKNIAQEKIVTPNDSSVPGEPLMGPLTLRAQVDIIREHTLKSTGGLTYAEMPRQVPKLNDLGDVVLDESGNIVMVENKSRNIWVTATTLMTALNLAILAYAFSFLILLFGLVSVWSGFVFWKLSKTKIN